MAKTARNKNLKPFTSENQPPGHLKSRKGIPNRKTVLLKLLDLEMDLEAPNGQPMKATLYEAAAMGLIKAAMSGNHKAFAEIQDTLHGKLTEKHEHDVDVNLPSLEDLKKKFEQRRKAVEALDD